MKNCPICGNPCEDSAKFCEVCGSQLPRTGAAENGSVPNQEPSEKAQNFVDDVVNSFKNTADTTAEYTSDDISSNRLMAALCYLGILVLIPLFARKDSPYVRFHANQGLVLLICELITNVFWNIPYFGAVIASILNALTFIFAIIGIINVIGGKAKELPLIGKIKILK